MGRGQGWPPARAGMAVGLLGGSFDPAHGGHVHLTRTALARLGLDRVWWLVSPGNPLKTKGPAPLDQRLARARDLVRHPSVATTDLETRLGTRHTARTIEALQARYPAVRFVWLMGADNLATFHLWNDWQQILHSVPVAAFARPGDRMPARLSPAARAFARYRVSPARAFGLAYLRPPAWTFLNMPMRDDSSSVLRETGKWGGC